MPRPRSVHRLIDSLAAQEEQFLQGEFLAPALRGGQVVVRIAGVICRLTISPHDFAGFGVFRPQSTSAALLHRTATLSERRRYLELFPSLSLILCGKQQDRWLGAMAHQGDRRVQIEGSAPIELAAEGGLFDAVRVRFDGARFWYEGPDRKRSPAVAQWLREQLGKLTPTDDLDRPGLTPEERAVYSAQLAERMAARQAQERAEAWARLSDPERKLRRALEHAGAQLVEYSERRDGYRVTYEVAGARHTSSVSKDNLSVQVAGICLSGEDEKFDLTSLVGVLREAQGVLRIGDEGMHEDQYWRVHPRRR